MYISFIFFLFYIYSQNCLLAEITHFYDVSDVVVRDIEVKYGEHATLSCMVSGLTNQVSVEWLYPTSDSEIPVPTTADYVQNTGSLDNTDLTQTSTLVISGSVVTEGKTFICRVSSSNYPDSPSSDTFVGLDVYGKS